MLEINFQKIKFWLVIAVVQILSFGGGILAGKNYFAERSQPLEPNYSTDEPKLTAEAPGPTKTNNASECKIKGNVSGRSKVYHLQGGAFYERTQEEACFNTESEAQSAGFIKSSR